MIKQAEHGTFKKKIINSKYIIFKSKDEPFMEYDGTEKICDKGSPLLVGMVKDLDFIGHPCCYQLSYD